MYGTTLVESPEITVDNTQRYSGTGPKDYLIQGQAQTQPRYADAPYISYHPVFQGEIFNPEKRQLNQEEYNLLRDVDNANKQQGYYQQPVSNNQYVPFGQYPNGTFNQPANPYYNQQSQQASNYWGNNSSQPYFGHFVQPQNQQPVNGVYDYNRYQQTPFSNPYQQNLPVNPYYAGNGPYRGNFFYYNGYDVFSGNYMMTPEERDRFYNGFYLNDYDLQDEYVQDVIRRAGENNVTVEFMFKSDQDLARDMTRIICQAKGYTEEETEEELSHCVYKLPHVLRKERIDAEKKACEEWAEMERNQPPMVIELIQYDSEGNGTVISTVTIDRKPKPWYEETYNEAHAIRKWIDDEREAREVRTQYNQKLFEQAPEREADNCTLLEFFNEYAPKIDNYYLTLKCMQQRQSRSSSIYRYETLNNILAKAGMLGYKEVDISGPNEPTGSILFNYESIKNFTEEDARKYMANRIKELEDKNPMMKGTFSQLSDGSLQIHAPEWLVRDNERREAERRSRAETSVVTPNSINDMISKTRYDFKRRGTELEEVRRKHDVN